MLLRATRKMIFLPDGSFVQRTAPCLPPTAYTCPARLQAWDANINIISPMNRQDVMPDPWAVLGDTGAVVIRDDFENDFHYRNTFLLPWAAATPVVWAP